MTKPIEKKSELEAKKKELKDEAGKLFAKGKLEKALEIYLQLWKVSQDDFRVKLKIGEILQKLNRPREAIAVYKKVAETYAKDGFLIQGISVCKIILALDAEEVETKNLLSSLYGKRGMEKDGALVTGAKETREVSAEELLDEFFAEDLEVSARELPTIPLFSELEKSEFQALIDSLTPWKVPEGTVVCKEGDQADSMFIIAYGGVRVETKDRQGKPVQLAVLKPGDFFGEIGLFTQTSRTADCITTEESDLLEIKRVDFLGIIKKFPRVKQVLHEFYQTRVLDTVLARSELFAMISPEIRKDLAKRFKAKEYANGSLVMCEGEDGNSLFMIRDGSVEVFTKKDGREINLAELHAGDFFGEVALLSGKKRTASVRAKGNCDCIRLDKADFDWLLKKCPGMRGVVKAYVDKRVEKTISVMMKA